MSESLTFEEQDALDKILAAMHAIQKLGPEGLKYNSEELAAAIHVLQAFVKQHVLHRLFPDEWSQWYALDDDDPRKRTFSAILTDVAG